jgi:nicotinamidase-related amidase
MDSALIVIDVQRELVDALAPQRREEFLTTLSGLIDRARAGGTPLVYVRHNDDYLKLNTPLWEIASEIAPKDGEPVVDKTFRDSFRETNLQDVLSDLGVKHLVLCGMQTEFCVDATTREAERRGYRVTLVEDGHATYADGGLSEEQIRNHVNRVARGEVAAIVPSDHLFVEAKKN